MDIIEKWKVGYVCQMGDDAFEWRKKEDVRDMDEDDIEQMFSSLMIFEPDGRVLSVIPLPKGVTKEEVDAAVAAGEISLYGDGMLLLDENEWREEDGKIKYKTSMRGEAFGEELDPWVELKPTEDGFELMFSRYVRA